MKNYICVFTKDVDNYNCNLQLRELKNSLGDSYINRINEEFSLSRIDDCIKESLDMGFSNFILLSEQNQTETLTDALREEYGRYFENIYSVGERFVRLKEDGQPGSQQDPDEGEDVVIQNNSEQDTGEDFLNDTTKQEKIDTPLIVSDVTGLGFTGGIDANSIKPVSLGEIFGENKTDKELFDKYNTTLISFYVFGGENIDKEFYSKLKSGQNYGKPIAIKNLDYDKFKKILVDNLGEGWESKKIWAENNYESATSYNNANVVTPLMLAGLKALAEGKVLNIKDTNNTETNTQNAQNNKTDNQNTGVTETSQDDKTQQEIGQTNDGEGYDYDLFNNSLDISNKNHLYENELVKSLKFLKKLKENTSSESEDSSKQKTNFFFNGVLNTKSIKNACFGIDENFAPTRDCSMGLQSYYGESNYKSGLFEISKFAYNLLENFIKKDNNWRAREEWCRGTGGTEKEPIIFSEDALVCFGGMTYDGLIKKFSDNPQQNGGSKGEPQKQSLKISSKNHLKEYSGSPNAGAQSQQQQVHTQFFKNFGEDRIKTLNDLYSKYAKQVTNIETNKANKSVSSQKPMVTPNFDNSIKRRLGADLEPMGEILNNAGQKQAATELIYNIKVVPSQFCSLSELSNKINEIDGSDNGNRFLVFEDFSLDEKQGWYIAPSKFCVFLEDIDKISKNNPDIIDSNINLNLLKNVYQSVFADPQTKLPHTVSSFLYSLPKRIASDVSGGDKTKEGVINGLKNIGRVQINISGVGNSPQKTDDIEKILSEMMMNSGNNFSKNNKLININNQASSLSIKEIPFKFDPDNMMKILQEKTKLKDIESLRKLIDNNEGTYQKLVLFLSQKCFLKSEKGADDGDKFLESFFSGIKEFDKRIGEPNQYSFKNGNNIKYINKESLSKLEELKSNLEKSPFKKEQYPSVISLLTSVTTLKQTFKDESEKYKSFLEICKSDASKFNTSGSDFLNLLKDTGLNLLRDFGDALWNDPWSEWKNYWDEQLKGTLTGALVKNIGNFFGALKDKAKADIKSAWGSHKADKAAKKSIENILSNEQIEMLKGLKKDGDLGIENPDKTTSANSNEFSEKPLDEKSISAILGTFKFLTSQEVYAQIPNLKALCLSTIIPGDYNTCMNNLKEVENNVNDKGIETNTTPQSKQGESDDSLSSVNPSLMAKNLNK